VKSLKAEVTAEKKTNSRLQSKSRYTSSEIITAWQTDWRQEY